MTGPYRTPSRPPEEPREPSLRVARLVRVLSLPAVPLMACVFALLWLPSVLFVWAWHGGDFDGEDYISATARIAFFPIAWANRRQRERDARRREEELERLRERERVVMEASRVALRGSDRRAS